MIGKSGSTSARIAMEQKFDAPIQQEDCQLHHDDQSYHKFTFVRDPLSRLVSSFRQELRKRDVNFKGGEKEVQALEIFIDSYDGTGGGLSHLRMQVPGLIFEWGVPKYNAIYDVGKMDEVFQKILTARLSNSTYIDDKIPENDATIDTANDIASIDQVIPIAPHLHHRKNGINISDISIKTRIKMCQLSALDFCCLNYELPQECYGHVKCKWTSKQIPSSESLPLSSTVLGIEAISPYPPIPNSDAYQPKNETKKQKRQRHKQRLEDQHSKIMDAISGI